MAADQFWLILRPLLRVSSCWGTAGLRRSHQVITEISAAIDSVRPALASLDFGPGCSGRWYRRLPSDRTRPHGQLPRCFHSASKCSLEPTVVALSAHLQHPSNQPNTHIHRERYTRRQSERRRDRKMWTAVSNDVSTVLVADDWRFRWRHSQSCEKCHLKVKRALYFWFCQRQRHLTYVCEFVLVLV